MLFNFFPDIKLQAVAAWKDKDLETRERAQRNKFLLCDLEESYN